MPRLFWRQFGALFHKNWIILTKHPFLNLLRCFILPVAYGIFLAVAMVFFNKPNNFGIGDPIPIYSLSSQFDGSLPLMWADGTNGTSKPSPQEIISHMTKSFTKKQSDAFRRLNSPTDIPPACPQNFNGFSECYAAVSFEDIPPNTGGTPRFVNYTIIADPGLFYIDVIGHKSDYEKRILPLQWAIDQAIIELQTGVQAPAPLEWPFSQETNEEQALDTRLSYISGISDLIVLAFFICYIGIAYQLPGAVAGDRATLLTEHMKAMGLLDSARVISWHLSISLAYLPAWIIVGVTWHFRIYSMTNGVLVTILHVILGLSLASWAFFVAAPFGKSPQLAAVVTTFLAIILAIVALVFKSASTGAAFIYTIIFPPGFYIFAIRSVAGFEGHQLGASLLQPDPDRQLRLLPLLIAAIIDIFLWPYLGLILERKLYDVREPSTGRRWFRKKPQVTQELPDGIAISVQNLNKTFQTSRLRPKTSLVTAIADLTINIPKHGIYVLLGSNGAGKSTALSILGGLASRTSGKVVFEGGVSRPPRGTIGIVPQRNVLIPELSCLQTLRVWRAVKWTDASSPQEDLEQLLRDCDLQSKIHANSSTLSGGQKRKLQLAIGLIGGSKIVLVDECTSGVDPLSRRAIWRTLTSYREERTIVFTTHFLDEADLLADHIAILAAPGKLIADGTPVSLKRDLGDGYSILVTFNSSVIAEKGSSGELLEALRVIAPQTHTTTASPQQTCYHLRSKDTVVVERVLHLLDGEKLTYNIASYDILGTSIEDIFLSLMDKREPGVLDASSSSSLVAPIPDSPRAVMNLSNSKPTSPLNQALTILRKRFLVARRSWLTPLLTIGIAIAGSTIPLLLIQKSPNPSCVRKFSPPMPLPLYLPTFSNISAILVPPALRVVASPPGIISTLGNSTQSFPTQNVNDNSSFVDYIKQNYRNISIGGVSVDPSSGASLFAWEAQPPGFTGPSLLNLVSNILYNQALNSSSTAANSATIIRANYEEFPPVISGALSGLKWIIFFGAAMAVYPAFFALYVTKERRTSVQAMQFSNGLTNPIGLWLGHLMFDTIISVIIATVVVIVLGAATSRFSGLGFFWFILVIYGITGALFSYCVSLIVTSPLAAFAAVAAYQIVMFLLYVSSYLLVLTFAKTSNASHFITIIHFTFSLISPVASVIRAGFVSINLFSLLCNGSDPVTTSSMGSLIRFGGPIVYLLLYPLFLLPILVWVESGSTFACRRRKVAQKKASSLENLPDESKSPDALLQVLNVSKTFGGNKVVDDVNFALSQNTVFAMLGPNGAGKTTTFNIIRGDIMPDSGDVLIKDTSVTRFPRIARTSLGVCPQFTAIDSQLTVREHLQIYGRLKGLGGGEALNQSVEAVLKGTSLDMYADRLASKLSGGNQRKLSLAIALIGNPPVLLIDEFSTGIDARMKREMWHTLRHVAVGKAVIITTHSMEEASALANEVGILASRLLAIGTTESLSARYPTYDVHFSCRTREDVVRAQTLMSRVPGSKMADDVATRFEVPIETQNGPTLAQLFHLLSAEGGFSEYTVEKASLESVFLKVIRENNVIEEGHTERTKRSWLRSLVGR